MSDKDQQQQEKQESPRQDSPRRGSNAKSTHSSQNGDKGSKKRSKSSVDKSRVNKLYRCPPTPPPAELYQREKTFVLDCNAASSISIDYSKVNPKLGPVIPPYNSQRDGNVRRYFRFYGVDNTLQRTGQKEKGGHSIEGPVMDAFFTRGAGFQYLSLRNQSGAGHSRDTIDGHTQFMTGLKPAIGYNGRYGFRRNTPWLRKTPSPFYPNIITPTF